MPGTAKGIDISGTQNYFSTGVVEHVTGINPMPNFQGKVTLGDCPVVASAVQPYPVDYQLSDFAPAGRDAVVAQARFSAPGVYLLRFTANDGLLTGYDELTVTVNAPP